MMEITIYQIDLDKDENRVAFIGHEALGHYQGTSEIDSAIYEKVYEGTVDAKDLEDVFRIFNVDQPEDYRGRSLSVSDIVETVDDRTGECTWHYCDTIGFKDVAFDPDKVSEMRATQITVVYVEPGKLAKTAEIGTRLEDLQAAVGGCIEAFYPFEEEVCIVCNDEGKFNGMQLNRGIYGEDGKLMDIIAGPFFICDCSGENFGSLSQEQLERYEKLYKKPEHFFKQNGEIVAVPYDPKEKTNER